MHLKPEKKIKDFGRICLIVCIFISSVPISFGSAQSYENVNLDYVQMYQFTALIVFDSAIDNEDPFTLITIFMNGDLPLGTMIYQQDSTSLLKYSVGNPYTDGLLWKIGVVDEEYKKLDDYTIELNFLELSPDINPDTFVVKAIALSTSESIEDIEGDFTSILNVYDDDFTYGEKLFPSPNSGDGEEEEPEDDSKIPGFSIEFFGLSIIMGISIFIISKKKKFMNKK